MADITMCVNNECKFRKECYRYCANKSPRQSISYFTPTPIDDQAECEWYYSSGEFLLNDIELEKRDEENARWVAMFTKDM